jgi:hypothetical protein
MSSSGQPRAWAVACVMAAIGMAIFVPNGSAAPPSTHLTPGAWRALGRVFSKTLPGTVRVCANRAGEASADKEVAAIEGMCVDEVALDGWLGRFGLACLGILDGPGATKASCRADIAGVDSSETASAAWSRWLASRLGAGGCRTFFFAEAEVVGHVAASGRAFVRALSAPLSNSAGNRAFHEWLAALHSGDHETPAQKRTLRADGESCRPPAG